MVMNNGSKIYIIIYNREIAIYFTMFERNIIYTCAHSFP